MDGEFAQFGLNNICAKTQSQKIPQSFLIESERFGYSAKDSIMKGHSITEMNLLAFKGNQRLLNQGTPHNLDNDDLIGIQTKAIPLVGSSIRDALTCVDMPLSAFAEILNFSLSLQNPKLHLNSYKPRKPWYQPGDNWYELNSQRKPLKNIPPFNRLLRSHYVNNINSSEFRILPGRGGLTLRVSFETDGKEIKGICRKCLGKPDKRAADSDIKPTKGNSEPYVDVNFSVSFTNGQLNLSIQSVRPVMKVDSNGILGWFNKVFTGVLKRTVREQILDYFKGNISELEQAIEQWIQANQAGLPIQITNLTFQGRTAKVCFKPNLPSGATLLAGGVGADKFYLGDCSTDYYKTAGDSDYALITNFNPSEGDIIVLHKDYSTINGSIPFTLVPSSDGLPQGIAIYKTATNELIGIVQGINTLSLSEGYFSFFESCLI